jgi:hypothetical protein
LSAPDFRQFPDVRTEARFAIFSNCPFSALLSSNPNHFDEIFHEDLPIVLSVGPSALCFIAAIAIFAPWLAQ